LWSGGGWAPWMFEWCFILEMVQNPQYIPNGPLHSLKLSGGQATYCSRHVKTYKYMLEKEAGFPIFPNMLSGLYI
jgi:hypothetical protein